MNYSVDYQIKINSDLNEVIDVILTVIDMLWRLKLCYNIIRHFLWFVVMLLAQVDIIRIGSCCVDKDYRTTETEEVN